MYFITEQKNNEPCLLSGNDKKKLYIYDLDHNLFLTFIPNPIWTHEKLTKLNIPNEIIKNGANAYLDEIWIGSTEC